MGIYYFNHAATGTHSGRCVEDFFKLIGDRYPGHGEFCGDKHVFCHGGELEDWLAIARRYPQCLFVLISSEPNKSQPERWPDNVKWCPVSTTQFEVEFERDGSPFQRLVNSCRSHTPC